MSICIFPESTVLSREHFIILESGDGKNLALPAYANIFHTLLWLIVNWNCNWAKQHTYDCSLGDFSSGSSAAGTLCLLLHQSEYIDQVNYSKTMAVGLVGLDASILMALWEAGL